MDVPIGDDGEAHRQAVLDATFTGFYSTNHAAVIRFLNRLEADRGMVEDVTQEAFLAVRARWDTVRGFSDPTAWLMVVAKNKLRTHQRRRGRTPTLFIDDITLPDLPEPVDSAEAEEYLARWIQLLPGRQAEIIGLVLEGWPDRKIAVALGISHNTVREYKVIARRRLQELAEQDGFRTPAGRRRR
jgi:RNA polymerase sigma factor (sigma-70 family)